MDVCNQSEHKSAKMRRYQLLTLSGRSSSGCGREHVGEVFPSNGCECLENGCLQPISTWISQDVKPKVVDTLLTLILRIRQWPCCCLLCRYKLPIYWLCLTATNALFNYCTYITTNHWRSVDTHFTVLSIQHLLPSTVVFIMIWTYW